jgi:acyl-CoA thioester hydrolase
MNSSWSSGIFEAGVHLYPVRVYYEDTDAGGIVYHANYLRFAERARSEFLRLLGWAHERLVEETGLVWVVRRAALDYMQPARLDDALMVETSLAAMKRASIDALQVIRRGADDLVRVQLQLVLLTPSGRLGRIPAALTDAFRPFLANPQP